MKADLHIHTSVSDCDYTIERVVLEAKKEGVTHLAITDHDTVLGVQRAFSLGEIHGIEVVAGIEISAYDYKRNRKAHILGYNIGGCAVMDLCRDTLEKRHNTSKRMYEALKSEGYDISWEEVVKFAGETGVFKQHIMLALIEKGYTDSIYGELYKKLFKGTGSANITFNYPDVFQAVEAVKKDGGIAVLAHPASFKNEELICELVERGLDGIEVYHPQHSTEDTKRLLEIARKSGLLITGGSDFHGDIGDKKSKLGSCAASEKAVRKIFSR